MLVDPEAPDFAHGLERFDDALAVVSDDGARLTYRQLAAAADAFASRLDCNHRLILIEGCNAPEAIIAYLGVLRSGRTALLHPAGTITGSAIAERFVPDAVYWRDTTGWTLSGFHRSTACHPDLALLLSTSGSTGSTKLVRISAGALGANANAIAQILELRPGERAITSLPISYTYGLSEVNSRLAAGATILLTEASVIDAAFWNFATREQATSMPGVPHSYELLAHRDLVGQVPPSLRLMTQAGGRLDPQLIKRFAALMASREGRFIVMYGQTEATARMSYVPADRLDGHWDCIGLPIPGGEILLRDENGQVVDRPGLSGELIYRGPNVMMGYALGPQDLVRGSELAELATGDLAERTEDGIFRVVGRLSRFVKPFGLRVSLDEIERQFEKDGIAAMVAGDDSLIVIAVLVGSGLDRAALAGRIANRLDLPMTLFRVAEVADWPLLPSGKRDYRALIDMERRSMSERSADQTVAEIFAVHFPRQPISPRSNFFELGGDSLNYVNVAVGLEDLIGPLPADWAERTVAELEVMARSNRADGMASGSIGADILLRALAIFLVVGDHASANRYIGGGAILLLMLAGFNLARFNRTALATGRVGEMLKRLAQNILAPYYLMILAYGLWKGEFVLSTVLLVSNWTNDTHGFLVPFWFIGAYVQTMLLVAALSVVSPRFRRTVAADPWRCGVVGFLASMVLTFAIGRLGWSAYGRSLDAVLPVFALGWCIAFADSPPRRFIVVLATIAYLAIDRGGFQLFSRDVSQAWPEIVTLSLAVMAMLFAPRLPFPRFLRGIAVAVAAATFTIYLTHTLVIWTIAKAVGHDNPGLWVAPLALAFGVVCHRVLGDISRRGSTSLTAIRVRPPERRVL